MILSAKYQFASSAFRIVHRKNILSDVIPVVLKASLRLRTKSIEGWVVNFVRVGISFNEIGVALHSVRNMT